MLISCTPSQERVVSPGKKRCTRMKLLLDRGAGWSWPLPRSGTCQMPAKPELPFRAGTKAASFKPAPAGLGDSAKPPTLCRNSLCCTPAPAWVRGCATCQAIVAESRACAHLKLQYASGHGTPRRVMDLVEDHGLIGTSDRCCCVLCNPFSWSALAT